MKELITQHIPHKKPTRRDHFPFMTADLRRLIRKRDKYYHKSKKSNDQRIKKHAKELKALVQRKIRNAYWTYIKNIICDPEEPGSEHRTTKRFWSFIKSLRKDTCGVSGLYDNDTLKSEPVEKANILNRQFQSVFTNEDISDIPNKGPSLYETMPIITIDSKGIEKLLTNINPHKACGPDAIPARFLKETAKEIAPILQIIYQKSIDTGIIPSTWKCANIAPIFKKGDRSVAANYRPVSLTCICSKIMEHVVVSNINKHLEKNNILAECQHGFRSKRSCETQLLTFTNEILENLHNGLQTDLIIMDFSKAFDKVPHKRLQHKLSYYGIRENNLQWISNFLSNRTQRVVIDGAYSESADVTSGVPQGTVLGPILFLLFINDLPDNLSSPVRLFADDCVLYRTVKSESDEKILQNDLNILTQWEQSWQMEFNPSKCHVMHVSRKRKPRKAKYNLRSHTLESVKEAKYLGITLTDKMEWTPHINNITTQANRSLGFLRRNLRPAPQQLKNQAYKALVRPKLEYCSSVWSPYTTTAIQQLERIQRRAARYVTNRHRNTSSVSDMLQQLNWQTLQDRRYRAILTMTFKIRNNYVAVPMLPYLANADSRSTRYSGLNTISIASTRTNYLQHSFFYKAPILWNSLPIETRALTDLTVFRTALEKIPVVAAVQ